MRRVAPASQAERANKKYFQQILKAHQHNLDSRRNLVQASQDGVENDKKTVEIDVDCICKANTFKCIIDDGFL